MSTIHSVDGDQDPLGNQARERWAKRAFDLGTSVPLCLVALPVIGVLAAILAVQLRAWPFFVHERIGHRGRAIAIPKLRTLSPGVAPYADKTATVLTSPSRLARLLRASHVDELPQLFLVPIGQLSMVGPRPRMRPEVEEHGDPRYEARRTSIQQGCTGLWQISGHHGRVSDHPEYDEFYLSHRSVRLDAWILWRTLRQLVVPEILELDDIPAWTLRRRPQTLADAA